MSNWPWYLSAAAVREHMAIAGWPDTDEGFERAEDELGALTVEARRTDRTGESGAEIWRSGRVRIGPGKRKARLEYTVMPEPRQEGDLPQLVRVRDKGGLEKGAGRRLRRERESGAARASRGLPVGDGHRKGDSEG